MPKNKAAVEDNSSSDDSGPTDRNPPPEAKKAKTESTAGGSSSKVKVKGSQEPKWALDKNRFVTVNQFKGKIYVNIREYYESDGDLKPGKKGISLSAGQWEKLKNAIPDIDEAVKDA